MMFWIGMYLLPLIGILIDLLIQYWTRERYSKMLLRNVFTRISHFGIDWDVEDWEFEWMLRAVLGAALYLLLFGFGGAALIQNHGIAWTFWILPFAGAVFLPRYILDMFHTLRYNFKTRDSDRLAQLEAEIASIKGRNS